MNNDLITKYEVIKWARLQSSKNIKVNEDTNTISIKVLMNPNEDPYLSDIPGLPQSEEVWFTLGARYSDSITPVVSYYDDRNNEDSDIFCTDLFSGATQRWEWKRFLKAWDNPGLKVFLYKEGQNNMFITRSILFNNHK